MNTDRDKYLTEAMGFPYNPEYGVFDFKNWTAFGTLWEWAQVQEWWRVFFMKDTDSAPFNHGMNCYDFNGDIVNNMIYTHLVNPDSFANSVYEFLKGRES